MTLLFSLVGGLLLAIALQLVFANLGIALGLSVLDWAPTTNAASIPSQPEEDSVEASSVSTAQSPLPITHFLGLGVAVGFSIVIFVAALLATEFSGLVDPRRSIIFGLIFWATYWLLFIWISSTTLAGIADSLLGTALKGGKQLVATVKQAMDNSDDVEATRTADSAAEETALETLIVEVSQLVDVQKELPTLLKDEREALLAEICDRTDLSSDAAETIAEKLEAKLEEAKLEAGKLEETPPENTVETEVSPAVPMPSPTAALMSQLNLPSWQQILRRTLSKVDLSDWDVETIWEQIPVETDQVKQLSSQLVDSVVAVLPESAHLGTETSPTLEPSHSVELSSSHRPSEDEISTFNSTRNSQASVSSAAIKAIQSKIVAFCRYTNTESLTAHKLEEKILSQLDAHGLSIDDVKGTTLDMKAVASVLSRRKKLSEQQQQRLLETLETVWPAATQDEAADAPEAAADSAFKVLEEQLNSVDWTAISLEDVKPEINLVLEQLEREGTLRSLDWQALGSRIQLPATAKAEFSAWLQTAWQAKVQALRPVVIERTQTISDQLSEQINEYLQGKEKSSLRPERMVKEFTHFVGHAITALPHPADLVSQSQLPHLNLNVKLDELLDEHHLRERLWDESAWRQALEKRKDLTAEEIQQILEWGEQVWQPRAHQLGDWFHAAQTELREHLSLAGVSLPEVSLPEVSLPEINLPDINLPSGQPLAEVRQKIVGQIELAQQKTKERAIALKEDLQRQADATRRQVAIAAWWLFIALVCSGSAAGGAGWLAAVY